ncbi:DnaJ domain-containing protein [Ectopseudomonas toyotomiensis]|uniref:DnaJ domain-containing protein n=1 Tax=Ectopseudomonas toyotomiensis TaxID=554344 RepID=A0AA42LC23_9GAMM|nr:DnaJ domain-containing protein [Pseudomonas toyotomiensis]MBG0839024.1 DnaJ domain-containing protein [Pseudomonas toyotomiensis]MDH0699901.1 DnaJ domain-containing protein [Pseudomonas toyotomiensis]
MRTHYDNLHVSEKASPEVIKGAYKALAQKWHPDKHPSQREKAERYFKIITRAFEVLSDPKARAEYDAWLADRRNTAEPLPDIEPAGEPIAQNHTQVNMAEAWENGKRSREQGFKETDCPYSQPELSRAWKEGFSAANQPNHDFSPRPWRRFFARFIDTPLVLLSALVLIFSFAVGLEALTGRDFGSQIHNSLAVFLIFSIVTLIAYETIFIENFAATPGKMILGVRVESTSGNRLRNGKAIQRACYVNIVGQGFQIPLLALGANIVGFFFLRKTGSTYWDDRAESVVCCKPMTTLRALSSILAVVIAAVLYAMIMEVIGRKFQ